MAAKAKIKGEVQDLIKLDHEGEVKAVGIHSLVKA
jgi:hypothetical protein